MRLALLAPLLLLPLLAIGCGGGDGSNSTPTPTQTSTPGTNPPAERIPVDDEGYLAVVCSGLSDFSDAILVATTAEEISEVVRDYIADLERIVPPADVVPFHEAFIQYLRDSVEEPTVLLTTPRPLPEASVRQRLSGKESSVSECRNMTFFSEREEESQ